MTIAQRCNKCGTVIDTAAPEGFCPSCLLESGLLGFEGEQRATQPRALMREFGDYELTQEIGRGGMGVVYEARHKKLNRIVALKVILVGQWASEAHVSRFTAEAEAAAKLEHANIVPIYEVGQVEGQHYFTMQRVRGGSLAQRISEPESRISHQESAMLLSTLARTVQYAHDRGVLHRDLKPSNILLDDRGKPHLMDFGLAKVLERGLSLTHTAAVLGTPSYMAPEQASGSPDELTPAADIYSLGAILYELLTGRPPFMAETPLAIVRQVLETEPIRPRKIKPGLPTDLETICLKCLRKTPQARYQSAGALADDLDRWLAGEPIRARPVAAGERLYLWSKRKPLAALCVFLAFGLLMLATLAGYRLRQGAVQAQEREWQSLLLQARETRLRGEGGRRFVSLELLAKAARIRPGIELRNEAIACLALVDLHPERRWPGYPAGSTAITFDPALGRYAVADSSGRISIREATSHRDLAELPPGNGAVVHLIFSPNGRFLAAQYGSADSASSLRVWKPDTANVAVQMDSPTLPGSIDFSPDSTLLAIGTSGGEIRLLEVAGGNVTRTLRCNDPPKAVRFDLTGTRLAALPFGTSVTVFDLAGTNAPLALSHPAPVNDLDWDPDDNHLAVACDDWKIHLWRFLPSVTERLFALDEARIQAVGFSRSGWHLATATADGALRIWDTTSGQPILARFGAGASQLRFDAGDRRLAFSLTPPDVTVWKFAGGYECRTLPTPAQYTEMVSFSHDGRILACAHNSGVWFYDLDQIGAVASPLGALSKLSFDKVNAILFEKGGQHLITSGFRGVYRWPIRSAQTESELSLEIGPPKEISASRESAERNAALSGDGRIMATLGVTPRVVAGTIATVDTPAEPWKVFTSAHAHSLALSDDGRWLAAAPYRPGEINVFDRRDDRRVVAWPVKAGAVAFAPGDKWLLTATPAEFMLWKAGDWRLHLRLPRPAGEEAVGPAAFSPDGTVLAVAYSARIVQLLDPASGNQLAILQAPRPSVIRSLAFSPDNTRLAVLTTTEGIQVWDLRLIRTQLAGMNLDWAPSPYAPASPHGAIKPLRLTFNKGP